MVLLALLVLGVLVYHWLLAPKVDKFLTTTVQNILEDQLKREVSVENIHLSFPNPRVVISNIAIARKQSLSEGTLFSAKSLQARVLLRSLISKQLIIDDIVLDTPTVWIEFDEYGRSNLPDLGGQKEEESKPPSRFRLDELVKRLYFPHIQLIDGEVYFDHKPQQLTVSVGRLNTTVSLSLQDLQTRGNISLEGGEVEYQDRGKLSTALFGDIDFHNKNLSLSSFQIEAGSSRLHIDGTVRNITQPALDLSVLADISLDEIDRFAKIHQNLTGVLHFEGAVTGQVPDIAANGHLTCPQGTAWKLGFENVDVKAHYQEKELAISALEVDMWGGRFAGNANLSFADGPGYRATLAIENVNIANVNSILEQAIDIAGNVNANIEAQGDSFSFDDLVLQASLGLHDDDIYGVEIARGLAQLEIRDKTFFINELNANVFQGNINAKGSLVLHSDFPYEIGIQSQDIELGAIMALIPEPPDVVGQLSGTIRAQGSDFDLEHLMLDTELEVVNLAAYDVKAKSIQTSANVKNQILSLSTLSAEMFAGRIQGTGRLVLVGETLPKFDAKLTLQDISVPAIMEQFAIRNLEQSFDVTGNIGGVLAVEGNSFALPDIRSKIALNGQGHINITIPDPANEERRTEKLPFELSLDSSLHNNVVDMVQLKIDSSALRLNTSGSIDLKGLEFDLGYQIASKDLQTLMKQILAFVPGIEEDSVFYQFAGNIEQLRGTLQGPVSQLEVQAKAHFSQADLVWVQADDLRTELLYQGRTLTIKQAQVTYRSAAIDASGSIELVESSDPELNLPVKLKTGAVSDYLAMVKQELPISGTLEYIDTTIRGPVSNLEADVGLHITKGSAWEQSFDSFDGELKLTENRIVIEAMTVKKNNGTITLHGFLGFDLSLQAELMVTNLNVHDIDLVESLALQYEGQMDASLKVQGTIQDPRGTANIVFKQLSYNGTPIEDITCDLSVENQAIQAVLATFRKNFIASFELELTPELPYRAELTMEQAAIEQILSIAVELEGITGIIAGKIRSEGSLRNLQKLSADVKLSQLELDISGQQIKNTRDIDIVVTQKELRVNSLELAGKELGLFAQGFLDFEGNFDLAIDSILELRAVQPFLPKTAGIRSLAGRLQLLANVRGTFQEPEIDGIAEIHRGNVRLAAYPDPISAITGKLAFTKGRIEILSMKGRVNKGSFDTYGTISYTGLNLDEFTIDLQGKNIVVDKVVESLNLTASPRIRVSGDLNQQKLAGEILIHDALYSQEIDLQALIGNKNRNLSLATIDSEAQASPLELELFIKAPQNIRFKNKLADINLKANMRVLGTAAKPQLEGRVEVLKGKIVFGDVRYDILGGVFDFLDPLRLNPEMNVQVETEIQEYKIRLNIEGNLDQFSLNMSSDPLLTDSEIAQLLTVGTGTQTKAYNFLSKPLQTIVEGQLEKAFNLDRISLDVDPLLSQNSKDSETAPTVTLAKRFFDALMLTYRTSVGGTTRKELIEVEYELSDGMAISARRDERGEFDTSVTFKIKLK